MSLIISTQSKLINRGGFLWIDLYYDNTLEDLQVKIGEALKRHKVKRTDVSIFAKVRRGKPTRKRLKEPYEKETRG